MGSEVSHGVPSQEESLTPSFTIGLPALSRTFLGSRSLEHRHRHRLQFRDGDSPPSLPLPGNHLDLIPGRCCRNSGRPAGPGGQDTPRQAPHPPGYRLRNHLIPYGPRLGDPQRRPACCECPFRRHGRHRPIDCSPLSHEGLVLLEPETEQNRPKDGNPCLQGLGGPCQRGEEDGTRSG